MNPKTKVTYWRDPDLEGLETCLVRQSLHVFPNHTHDQAYAIGMMIQGGCYCFGPAQKDSFISPGELAFINPGQVHSGVPSAGIRTTYRMLYVDLGLMSEAAGDILESVGRFPEFQKNVLSHPVLFRGLLEVCRLIPEKFGPLEKETRIVRSFANMLSEIKGIRPPSRTTTDRRIIRRAKDFLASDLEQKISLEEAARSVGLSRYHFLRMFKKETGLSPHQFRTQLRIERAKGLMRSKVPLVQVALETGFADQSHFTNKFRQFTGATPSQYLSAL